MKEKEPKKWEDYSIAEKALIVIFFIGIIFSLFSERPGSTLAGWTILCAILFGILKILIFIRNKFKK